ncbi:copper resistance D family protein [Nakamurella sp. GG22]
MLNIESRRTTPEPATDPSGNAPTAAVIGSAAFAGILAILIARWWTATGYQPAPAGLPDAGPLTSIGLPIAQFLQRVAGVAVVGLLFLRCLGSRGRSPEAAAHLAAMTVRWAVVWAIGTTGWMVMTLSFLTGVPASGLPGNLDAVLVLLGSEQLLAAMATLWVAVLIALFGSRIGGVPGSAVLLVLSAAALLPSALSGHAGHHGSPTAAMTALGLHLLAAAVWVGGLLAMVLHLRRFPSDLRSALPGFSTAALLCLVAVGASGLIESVLMLDGWPALVNTERGQLIIAKTLAIVLMAAIGHCHRRHTLGSAASGRLLPLVRLAGVELAVMAATIGIAVVLSTTG